MVVLRCKCLVIGDVCVGKSALAQVFHSDGAHFPKAYTMTSGVDVSVKAVHIPDSSQVVEMILLDCAGHESFEDVVAKFWQDVGYVIIVYDVTRAGTFQSVTIWLEKIRAALGGKIKVLLVGNKADLTERRVVTHEEGAAFARTNSLTFFEASAKSGEGVDTPFHFVANSVHTGFNDSVTVFDALVA